MAVPDPIATDPLQAEIVCVNRVEGFLGHSEQRDALADADPFRHATTIVEHPEHAVRLIQGKAALSPQLFERPGIGVSAAILREAGRMSQDLVQRDPSARLAGLGQMGR